MNNISIADVVLQYAALLFSLCFHEAAHAAMSNRCGDPSARLLGRLSLNPIKHIDPIGTVVLPLFVLFTGAPYVFGWAKPVPFNPRNLNDMRRDTALIGLAGPLSNLLLAITCVLVLRVILLITGALGLGAASVAMSPFGLFLLFMTGINLVLMVFNLIPVPPLDGHHVLYYFLPPGGQKTLEQIGPFGILIAIFLARPVFSVVMPPLVGLVRWAAFSGTGIALQ